MDNRGQSTHENTMSLSHAREILGLKTRSLTTLVEHYDEIFEGRPQLLDHIPKTLRKELFSRLVLRGKLDLHLFCRTLDQGETLLDLKSAAGGVNNACCDLISRGLPLLTTLYVMEVSADSHALGTMFSSLPRLKCLEITNSPSFNDRVANKIAESCPCLKVLNASRTELGDLGMQAFAENSFAFMALDISHTKVTFEGMRQILGSPTRETLRELKCRGTHIYDREHILNIILSFKRLEDYSFHFESNEDANFVLSRVTTKLKNMAFTIPL